MNVTLSVGVDPDIVAQLRRIAAARDRSLSWCAGQAIKEYVEREMQVEKPAAQPRTKGKAA